MLMPWAVVVSMLMRARPPAAPIDIVLIDVDLSNADRRRIGVFADKYLAHPIRLVPFDARLLDGCPNVGHLSKAAYARLLLPELLPELDRVLYLDADLLIYGDVRELWQTDTGDKVLAAVPDPGFDSIGDTSTLGYATGDLHDSSDRCFNSGVMLMELDRCRNIRLTRRCLEFVRKHAAHLHLADQDALNAVCSGRYHALDGSWNYLARVGDLWRRCNLSEDQPRDKAGPRSHRRPNILHLASALKPWNAGPRHPYLIEFARELRKAHWLRFSEWPKIAVAAVGPYWLRRRFHWR
jgi:lipopolysaccharide biosynthesis glycosyltransferase